MQDVCKCVNRSNKMRCKVRAGAHFRRGWLQRIACANPKVNSQIVNSQSCNSRGKKSRMGPPRRSFLVFDHLIFGVDNFALCLYMPWQNQSSTPQSITGFSPSMAEPLFPCHPMILHPEHLTHRRRPFFGSVRDDWVWQRSSLPAPRNYLGAMGSSGRGCSKPERPCWFMWASPKIKYAPKIAVYRSLVETCGEIVTSSGLKAVHFQTSLSIHSSLFFVAESPLEYVLILRLPICEMSAAADMHTDCLVLVWTCLQKRTRATSANVIQTQQ